MKHSIINIVRYLHLKDVGAVELMFALTPILSSYSISGITMSVLIWVILIVTVFSINSQYHIKIYKPLLLFILYWCFRTIFLIIVDNLNINGVIAQIVYFIAVFTLYPNLNFNKVRGSINWVAIIAILGLLYQWTFVSSGIGVHPIEIPGLSMQEYRLESLSLRPSSFFMEPAAYVSYMICTTALALMERKYLWAIVIILTIFLSGSTTGLLLSFVILGMSVLGNKTRASSAFATIIIGFGLFYSLTHFHAFDIGVEKLENTNTEENVRLTQGKYIVSTMRPNEFVFGVPYSTAYNYCISGRAPYVVFYGESVYVSTFWLIILLYGVVGLILYINIYWQIVKYSRRTLPLATCLCALMFSAGFALGSTYFFTLILLLVIARGKISISNKN